MARIHISNDPSDRIIVSFPYDPLSSQGQVLSLIIISYTHVSTKSLGKIMSPLDTPELAKGGDE